MDAKAAGKNFLGGFGESKHSRTARKRLDFENMWIFRHFSGAQAGQFFWGTFVAIYALLLLCRKCRDLRALGAQKTCESLVQNPKCRISSPVYNYITPNVADIICEQPLMASDIYGFKYMWITVAPMTQFTVSLVFYCPKYTASDMWIFKWSRYCPGKPLGQNHPCTWSALHPLPSR